MRIGLFCTYENPQRDYAAAFADQTRLVQHIEAQGFDEAWVAEHHFNPDAASPSCLAILAHLAAKTERIRLGSAAVLLPFRNPIQVAEDVATLDILSQGRFDFGIAKGGPFPIQNKHFGLAPDDIRPKTLEALALIERLLTENDVTFSGRFFQVEGMNLTPKPVQKPIPTFVATSTADTVRLAADRGFGIMAAPPFPLAQIAGSLKFYRDAAPGLDPRLVLIRFFHVAATREAAFAEARPMLQPFVERMRKTTVTLQPDWTPWFELDRLIEDSLIGTQAEIAEKVAHIEAELRPRTLLLKVMSPHIEKRVADLDLFAEKIRPRAPVMAA